MRGCRCRSVCMNVCVCVCVCVRTRVCVFQHSLHHLRGTCMWFNVPHGLPPKVHFYLFYYPTAKAINGYEKRGRGEEGERGEKRSSTETGAAREWENKRGNGVDYKAVIYLLVSNKSVAFIISVWFCDLKSLCSFFLFSFFSFFFCCCVHSFLHNDCIRHWQKNDFHRSFVADHHSLPTVGRALQRSGQHANQWGRVSRLLYQYLLYLLLHASKGMLQNPLVPADCTQGKGELSSRLIC